MTLKSHGLPYATDFVYGGSTASGSRKSAVSLQRDLDQQEGTWDGDAVMKCESNEGSDSRESRQKFSAYMLEEGKDFKNDQGMT